MWRIIPNTNKKYEASIDGEIRNYKTKKVLKKYISKNGYYILTLYCTKNKKENFRVHRLIAETFIKRIYNKLIVNHKDGNKLNNKVENLEWCTYSENLIHAYENDLRKTDFINEKVVKRGEENHSAKLNEKDIHKIIFLNRQGLGCRKITQILNNKVSYGTISNVLIGRTWKHITKNLL